MESILTWVARLAGLAGAVMLIAAIVSRAMGMYWLEGVQVGSLLHLGNGLMILGVLCYAVVLAEFRRRG